MNGTMRSGIIFAVETLVMGAAGGAGGAAIQNSMSKGKSA